VGFLAGAGGAPARKRLGQITEFLRCANCGERIGALDRRLPKDLGEQGFKRGELTHLASRNVESRLH
jgi:hypothetical protein